MRRQTSAIYIIVAVVLILVFGLLGRAALPLRWLLVMGVLVGLLVALGREVTGSENEVRLRSGRTETRFSPGRIDGVLIDPRHKISLSRLQLILWTVIVLSAWATLALHRTIPVLQGRLAATGAPLVESIAGILAGGQEAGEEQAVRAAAIVEQLTGVAPDAAGQTEPAAYDALDIEIPQEVLLALGISLASLAGSGVIKANQATNEDGRAQEIVAARQERAAREVAAGQHAFQEPARVGGLGEGVERGELGIAGDGDLGGVGESAHIREPLFRCVIPTGASRLRLAKWRDRDARRHRASARRDPSAAHGAKRAVLRSGGR